MAYPSVFSPDFQAALKHSFDEQGEVLALFRFSHAAGSRDYEFFPCYATLQERIARLPQRTCVTIWGQPQLPLRGRADASLLEQARRHLPEGKEWLLLGLER